MNPSRAAKELLEKLGDGQHVLRKHQPSYVAYRRNREDMKEIFLALVLLTEELRQGVQNTDLQGWYPELTEGRERGMGREDFILSWEGGFLKFHLTREDDIRYSYKDGPLAPVTRMVGETMAEAVTRMVFQMLEPVYTPSLFTGLGVGSSP